MNTIDKGPLDYFLRMEMERKNPRGGITINQYNFIDNLIKRNNIYI